MVALKGMYTQAAELKRFHKESIIESLTWIVTFSAVVLVDVDIGYVSRNAQHTVLECAQEIENSTTKTYNQNEAIELMLDAIAISMLQLQQSLSS